jgi:hypothetical protein
MFEKLLAESGGLDGLLEQFRDGLRTKAVADHYGVSRAWLTGWLRHPDRKAAYLDARRIGGTALMEDAADLCDDVPPERDAIMKARLQFESRRVLAGAFDPETFGEKGNDVTVTVNTAELHVNALRHRVVEATRPLAELMRQPPARLTAGLTEVDVTAPAAPDVPDPAPPVERHGVDGNADAGTLWCHDCRRNDCRHVKQEYARQAQHYTDTHAPRVLSPRSRGIV